METQRLIFKQRILCRAYLFELSIKKEAESASFLYSNGLF